MSDGLMDIYLGIMLIPYSFWIYNPDFPVSMMIMPFIAYAIAQPIFMLLKKRVVTPRVGSIKPGPVRHKKTHVLFVASVVGATALVAWIVSTPRFALYGLLAAVSIPVDAVYFMRTGNPSLTLVTILIMIGTGVTLFVHFLKTHPVHAEVEFG